MRIWTKSAILKYIHLWRTKKVVVQHIVLLIKGIVNIIIPSRTFVEFTARLIVYLHQGIQVLNVGKTISKIIFKKGPHQSRGIALEHNGNPIKKATDVVQAQYVVQLVHILVQNIGNG